ncbi:hypothetical protein F4703DRAFT_1857809 [Phycomyces blakesleeanus]
MLNYSESDLPQGSILESDSPEPSLLTVASLSPERDYKIKAWKNGLGTTSEISIYPPKKDFRKDTFFWRLSLHRIEADCNFTLFPGYYCTTVVLPSQNRKAALLLNHQGDEVSTKVKPLFPYSWHGEWASNCKVTDAPVTSLQFMIKRDLGTAQFDVDKIGQPVSNESGETGKKLILGSFALVYVVEGYVRISVDEDQSSDHIHVLSPGQTLYVEHDEESTPVSMTIKASDMAGNVNHHELDATVLTIQISEIKGGGPSSTVSDYFISQRTPTAAIGTSAISGSGSGSLVGTPITPGAAIERSGHIVSGYHNLHPMSPSEPTDTPSRRREPHRKGSLVIADKFSGSGSDLVSSGTVDTLDSSSTATTATMATTATTTATATATAKKGGVDQLLSPSAQSQQHGARIYSPPTFGLMYDTDTPPPVVRDRLVVDDFPKHSVSTAWIKMIRQGLNEWIRLPVIICRGSEEGPVVGITAAVHGNELNGVPCIHRVVAEIDVQKLHGTVVAVPCVNVTGYLKFSREFADGRDLNRLFPGKEDGFASQVYCYQLMNKIISQFNYLIDLHTASFGRVNSYYVRADMNDAASATMAHLQKPQILLHNSGQDGTLRSAASARGIKAVTVEIGNPQLFQNQYIEWSFMGVMRILDNLDMFALCNTGTSQPDLSIGSPPSTILCSKGFWIYTTTGGVLEVYPAVNTIIRKGDLIARIKNIFGNVVDEYFAPCGGIVIGRSSNPVAMSGDRILHLGVIKKKGENLPKEAKENY